VRARAARPARAFSGCRARGVASRFMQEIDAAGDLVRRLQRELEALL
jgi:hypothetical protein